MGYSLEAAHTGHGAMRQIASANLKTDPIDAYKLALAAKDLWMERRYIRTAHPSSDELMSDQGQHLSHGISPVPLLAQQHLLHIDHVRETGIVLKRSGQPVPPALVQNDCASLNKHVHQPHRSGQGRVIAIFERDLTSDVIRSDYKLTPKLQ